MDVEGVEINVPRMAAEIRRLGLSTEEIAHLGLKGVTLSRILSGEQVHPRTLRRMAGMLAEKHGVKGLIRFR